MAWFRREPPPPPPSKIPGWVSLITPVIMAIILGLSTLVYNGVAGELKELKDEKADKEITYKQIEQNQILLKEHQKTLDDTLKVIMQLQLEQKQMQQQPPVISPPANVQVQEKPPLTPREFQEYMKLSKDERAAFRKLHPSYATLPE